MTKGVDKAKEKFINVRQEFIELYDLDNDLEKRLSDAETNIANLQEEKEELRQQRPAMLADNEDVTEINSRLKDIDNEIELNQDTITGIEAKRKTMRSQLARARHNTNMAYKNYINWILADLRKKYMKVAPKLAELLKDYITLEQLRDGDGTRYVDFGCEDIRRIPNFKGKYPLFTYNSYNILMDNMENVLKKYDIPEYHVRRVSMNEY